MSETTTERTDHHGDVPGYHHIEEAMRVYLHASPDGTGWTICDTTNDGSPLFSDYEDGPLNEACECGDDEACDAAADRLARLDLPTSDELMRMLADSLGFDVVKRAVCDPEGRDYDHVARPDDLPEPGDRCKDCGEEIAWEGPDPVRDWMHVNDRRNRRVRRDGRTTMDQEQQRDHAEERGVVTAGQAENVAEWASELNDSAQFYPRMCDDELPEIVVGGVGVTVYVDETGHVRVSIHTDGGNVNPHLVADDGERVPMRIKVNDTAVWEDRR